MTPAPAQQSCDHGECFGGKCVYAKGANTIESLRRQVAELGEHLGDANTMLEKCNSKFIVELEAENAALREELVEAWEAAIDWAQYASPYFQEKWGLAEDIKKLERARGHAKNDAK